MCMDAHWPLTKPLAPLFSIVLKGLKVPGLTLSTENGLLNRQHPPLCLCDFRLRSHLPACLCCRTALMSRIIFFFYLIRSNDDDGFLLVEKLGLFRYRRFITRLHATDETLIAEPEIPSNPINSLRWGGHTRISLKMR